MSLESYLRAMPKVELHVHLEGSTQPQTLLTLAERNGIKLPVDTVEALRQMYVFRDFGDFLKVYMMIVNCLRTPEDFSELVYQFGADRAQQNIRYSEVTWTPQVYVKDFGLPYEALLEGINDGRARAEREWGVTMRWIPDIIRNVPEHMNDVQAWVCSDVSREGGVVALGLGGMEVGYPPEMFIEPFRRAHEMGVPSNPHSGETAGPESIWGALRALGANRIGHGVRSVEDPVLVQYLVEHQVPLEVCPTSNLCLQVYPSYEAHPLKMLVEAGCIVTVNSDDPPLFNTTLTDEYRHAIQDCGLTVQQLEKTILDGIRVNYLADGDKTALRNEFEAEFARLRLEHGISDDV
jgi:adenosine deaminase